MEAAWNQERGLLTSSQFGTAMTSKATRQPNEPILLQFLPPHSKQQEEKETINTNRTQGSLKRRARLQFSVWAPAGAVYTAFHGLGSVTAE